MKYFEVKQYSTEMCGFDSCGYFAAESEKELHRLPSYLQFCDAMQDYVNGWVTEEDLEENEDAAYVGESVREIDEAEYLENMAFYPDPKHPYHCG